MRFWFLFLATLLVPTAAAQPMLDNPETWDTVLYAHPGGFADGVLSPESVPDEVRLPSGQGDTVCQDGLLTAVWVLDPASGVPTYQRTPSGWHAGLHGNAPLADLTMQADSLELDWYVQTDGTAAGLQDAVLTATLFDMGFLDRDDFAADAPQPYVSTTTQPADLTPTLQGHPDVSVHEVDGTTVYGFHVVFPLPEDLTIGAMRSDMPDPGESFHLEVRLQGDDSLCATGVAAGRDLLLHSTPGLRPQMRFTELGPAWIEALRPFAGNGTVGVEAALGHPFGSGGLWIPASPPMRITGPAELPVTAYQTSGSHGEPLEARGDRWPIDHIHGDPGRVVQAWSLQDAPAGTYIATWTVEDPARSGNASASAVFEVSADGDVSACTMESGSQVCRPLSGTPGHESPLPWLIVPLAGALAFWRRRDRFSHPTQWVLKPHAALLSPWSECGP